MSTNNPNSKEFYNTLYTGTYEVGGISMDYEYEGADRAAWYQRVAKLPFLNNCEGRILDVGCGIGGLFSALPVNSKLEKYGIDFSEVAIKKIKERVNGHFIIGDIHRLPYDDNFFERVVSTQTLEHVDEPDIAIGEMCRVLKPGRKLFITVPEKTLDLKPADWPGGIELHVNKFSIESLVEAVQRYGLEVDDVAIYEKEIWLTASKKLC